MSSIFPSVGIGNGGTWSGGLAQWYLFSEADVDVAECNAGGGSGEDGYKDRDEDVDIGAGGGRYKKLVVDGGGVGWGGIGDSGKVGSKAGAKVGGIGGGNKVDWDGGKVGWDKVGRFGWGGEVGGAVWRCVLYKDESR